MESSHQRFRALARSSPWLWRTLQGAYLLRAAGGVPVESVRVWIRRPSAIRVERLDGTVVLARSLALSDHGARLATMPGRLASPLPTDPQFDAEGLVRVRPRRVVNEDPIYRTYLLAAALDPVELADGTGDAHGPGCEAPPAVDIDDVFEVAWHGRPTWEAQVRPTACYNPRCACCPLLPSEASDDLEAEQGGTPARALQPAFVYPRAHEVRLDAATGVCVSSEALGGTAEGRGHELVIEALDEPMADKLFRARGARGWWPRRRARS